MSLAAYTSSEELHDALRQKLTDCQCILVELVFNREGTFSPEYEAKLQGFLLQIKEMRQNFA